MSSSPTSNFKMTTLGPYDSSAGVQVEHAFTPAFTQSSRLSENDTAGSMPMGMNRVSGRLPWAQVSAITQSVRCNDARCYAMIASSRPVTRAHERAMVDESQSFNARTCGIPQRDHAAMIKILSWTLFCSATVFFLMRVVACAFSNNGFRGDDWFVFSCYAALAGSTVCIHLATANGLGAENYLFDVGQLEKVKMLFYTFELLGNFILFGTKVALVLLYLRILPSSAVSYAYRSLCWSFVGLLILTFIATELAMILQCLPITSIWNFYPGEAGQCLDMATLQRAASALDLIYSMVLLFLPIPPLLATERSPVQQIGLICIYIAGIAIIICSLGRTVVSSPPTLTTTTIKAAQPTDLTQPVIWTLLQLNLSLILISLPPLSSLSNHSLIRIRIKPNSILPHSGSAEEILAEEDRRRSGLQSTTLEIKAFGHDGGDGGTNGNGEDVRRNNYNINGIDERINDSPGLHVGVGDATVTFQHNIPKAATRDKIVYRDAEGLMHEVELIDRPGLIVEQ
ncbi:hypothetical protein CERZMDRAFT_94057 [Cercospora zeae-maydis SCOH1-5]|uniref:Rhodopsin domain-containing protein n=1 Tax=Cercospora zeae-maydis SCOH1-5 TaxID=717836 RepID=A0A6A6FQA6_9PEZI|nr:hypothetical protein CERZMDRAFT_94057 [Cercospora zeae-maydis SCOH1-5]